ncbi:glycoside hydrolase family 88 protein [Salipaludibacillus agaradhaerens]|jgi:unsaturated rhamnogalacturonyl hydrolase|uniref:Glycoside hydrolase family 88 protein n=1 Tax=Salipaludibacillus agaradhaerens TaxID=76935 RepID=A0A9Q4AZL7_SALAG|nr:glycoside hydrolase family 88 protein [Salipaludibacillus agaradhaerens]MCR6095351.1 glycoside hydrolase family 88 protein [Salipaludibacillus agaradhaerens]MCR6115091.1 glycoside hydrolase family 88 protein [Salipaludibacillus agaradhaerens]
MEDNTFFLDQTPLEWAEQACQSLMNTYEPIMLPPKKRWHYHQGVFLCGMIDVWKATQDDTYYEYVKEYVDGLVDDNGNVYFARDELDAIQAGQLLFPIYNQTKEAKYAIAAKKLRQLINTINRTSEGGFWHKDKYPYQMWLDGLYMAGPFLLMYGEAFNEPELVDTVLHQEELMRTHTKDDTTGLYFHGWDERGETPWTEEGRYHAPEIWGRALGWYGMALTMIVERLPENHPKIGVLQGVIQKLVKNIVKFQDEETGLWYQIVPKGKEADNWLETSCTSLFVLTILRAVNDGYVDNSYAEYALKGYKGIINHKVSVNKDGVLSLKGICIGTSIGTYDYYVNRETSVNDLHGVGTFVLASVQLHDYLMNVEETN